MLAIMSLGRQARARFSKRAVSKGDAISKVLAIGAVFVITWGVMQVGLLGPTPLGFGLAGQLVHYGVSVKRGHRLAVSRGWSATAAVGAVTLMMGVTLVTLLVWSAFFALAILLNHTSRTSARRPPARIRECDPAQEMMPRRTAKSTSSAVL